MVIQTYVFFVTKPMVELIGLQYILSCIFIQKVDTRVSLEEEVFNIQK